MKKFLSLIALCLSLLAPTSSYAATTFLTNDNGNAAALDLDGAGNTTALTLSGADGGGTIGLTTIAATQSGTAKLLGMGTTGMGISNDSMAGRQVWTFSLDQEVSFDGLGLVSSDPDPFDITLSSTAWIGASNATGTGWSFNGTTGEFAISLTTGATTSAIYDFTSAGVGNISAGTSITIANNDWGGDEGNGSITQFTITPVPEPSAAALIGLAALILLMMRRRH